MDHDQMIVILSPLDGERIAGAVQVTADCGHPAWIAPTGLHAVLNPALPTKTICQRCLTPAHWKLIREQGMRALPGAREELAEELGAEVADDIYRRYGVKEWLGD